MTKPAKAVVYGQPSWRLASDKVELYVTETGGHLGPVTFNCAGRKVKPYSVAPWVQEKTPGMPPLIKVLRGDFFCMPFGGNGTAFRGEKHPVHGETANAKWTMQGFTRQHGLAGLHLGLKTTVRPARVDKRVLLLDGHNAVYCQHLIRDMRGPMDLGHHAMVKFPDQPGSGVISTSPFMHGQVYPGVMEAPENRGYSQLKPGATFKSLDRVPTVFGTTTDVSRYPARRGFEDLVMLSADIAACPCVRGIRSARRLPFAWTAVTFAKERYVWFALRDPNILRSTIFWISNGGRHYPPWNGRHVNVMGLEEVTSYFHEGLAESARKNSLTAKSIPTCHQFQPNRPLTVNYIMATVPVPRGFERVSAIVPSEEGVLLKSAGGPSVDIPMALSFLWCSGC